MKKYAVSPKNFEVYGENVMLQKMIGFLNRLDEYDEHMMTNIKL